MLLKEKMKMLVMYLSVCFAAIAVVTVNGYKSGAPVVACDNMTPGHNVEAQVCLIQILDLSRLNKIAILRKKIQN